VRFSGAKLSPDRPCGSVNTAPGPVSGR
jgi:hypothetical protein